MRVLLLLSYLGITSQCLLFWSNTFFVWPHMCHLPHNAEFQLLASLQQHSITLTSCQRQRIYTTNYKLQRKGIWVLFYIVGAHLYFSNLMMLTFLKTKLYLILSPEMYCLSTAGIVLLEQVERMVAVSDTFLRVGHSLFIWSVMKHHQNKVGQWSMAIDGCGPVTQDKINCLNQPQSHLHNLLTICYLKDRYDLHFPGLLWVLSYLSCLLWSWCQTNPVLRLWTWQTWHFYKTMRLGLQPHSR